MRGRAHFLSSFQGQVEHEESGVALLTVLMVLVAMTIIGIGAITLSGFGNKLAGYGRAGESATNAAEACIGTAVKIIQDTQDQGAMPAAYLSTAVPAGPVPVANGPTLESEIFGRPGYENSADTPQGNPNLTQAVNGFTVNGDIDRLYKAHKPGNPASFGNGYEQSGPDIYYRIDCVATSAVNTTSHIVAVYVCAMTGESCQRKP
jgi:hypothetical protein